MRYLLVFVVVGIGALMAYIRLAPVPVERLHTTSPSLAPGDYPAQGRFTAVRRVTGTPDEVLAAVREIAMSDPRTRLIAGDVAQGMLTFETRSLIWGFPDYTTVSVDVVDGSPLLTVHARLRFGVDDLGVNKARVQTWLTKLGPVVSTP